MLPKPKPGTEPGSNKDAPFFPPGSGSNDKATAGSNTNDKAAAASSNDKPGPLAEPDRSPAAAAGSGSKMTSLDFLHKATQSARRINKILEELPSAKMRSLVFDLVKEAQETSNQ